MVNKGSLAWLREERQHIRNRAADLSMWKVVAPAAVLLLFWPIYGCILEVEQPFVRAFAHGDYILFAALLLLEISVESERLVRQTATFRLGRNALRLTAMLLIVVFGFWKNDVLVKEAGLCGRGGSGAAVILTKLHAYALFSCAVALLAAAYSIYALLMIVERESGDLFRRLAGEG